MLISYNFNLIFARTIISKLIRNSIGNTINALVSLFWQTNCCSLLHYQNQLPNQAQENYIGIIRSSASPTFALSRITDAAMCRGDLLTYHDFVNTAKTNNNPGVFTALALISYIPCASAAFNHKV